MISTGSLCAGYGGIELGLAAAGWPIRIVWHADKDRDAAAVLAARWPGVPNLGDITTIGRCVCGGPLLGPHDEEWHDEERQAPGPDDGPQWRDVEPVELVTAGFPCQPFSVAGRQEGEDDERWLWDDIANAVGGMVTRPRMLVLENVPGLLTTDGGNAMARVVRGLAALGYVGRYRVLRAADVGAPHARARVFIVAELADAPRLRRERPAGGEARARAGSAVGRDADDGLSLLPTPGARLGDGRGAPDAELAARRMGEQGRRNLDDAIALLPTPAARDADHGAGWGDKPGRPLSETVHRLLPTPRATDGTKSGPNQSSNGGASLPMTVHRLLPTPNATDAQGGPRALPAARTHDGTDHGPRLRDVAPALLPTPTASRYGSNQSASEGAAVRPGLDAVDKLLPTPTAMHWARSATAGRTDPRPTTHTDGWTLADVAYAERWGEYGPAIARWEQVLNRPAPDPTEPGRTGAPRLAPPFVEWMQGLDAGWVTAVPGLSRNAMLRLLGNGVVPQQIAAAVTLLLPARWWAA